jgi:hypothetical protein
MNNVDRNLQRMIILRRLQKSAEDPVPLWQRGIARGTTANMVANQGPASAPSFAPMSAPVPASAPVALPDYSRKAPAGTPAGNAPAPSPRAVAPTPSQVAAYTNTAPAQATPVIPTTPGQPRLQGLDGKGVHSFNTDITRMDASDIKRGYNVPQAYQSQHSHDTAAAGSLAQEGNPVGPRVQGKMTQDYTHFSPRAEEDLRQYPGQTLTTNYGTVSAGKSQPAPAARPPVSAPRPVAATTPPVAAPAAKQATAPTPPTPTAGKTGAAAEMTPELLAQGVPRR